MIPIWPTELPKPQRNPYQAQVQDPRLRRRAESGPPGTRRRFSAAARFVSLSIDVSRAEKAVFDNFLEIETAMISFDAKTGWPAVDDSVFPGDTDNGDGTFSRPPARPKYSLESAKAMILEYVKAFEDHVTGLVSTGEQLSWADKEVAAIAFQDGTATAEQLEVLQDEADETGETLAELAALIVAKGKRYRKLVRKIAGLRRATYMWRKKAR